MKYITTVALALVLTVTFTTTVLAESDHEDMATQGKALIESQVSCSDLTDDQLESIGEYVMEQMHPGDVHEVMDDMMGGEGSDSLRQAHIFMARRWYCGDATGMGMMGMMMGNWNMMGSANNVSSGMMGGGMMNWGNSKISNQNGDVRSYGASMMGIPTVWHQGVSITSVLLWVFLLTGIAACVKYLVKKQ